MLGQRNEQCRADSSAASIRMDARRHEPAALDVRAPGQPRADDVPVELRNQHERVGLGAQPVRVTVVNSQEQAEEQGFVGSPTIRIDGVDPFAVPGQSPAVACRVYATPSGLSGVPPLADVVTALAAARDRAPVTLE